MTRRATETSLQREIASALEQRHDAPLITVLGRRGRHRTMTGAELGARATEMQVLWDRCLGEGPHVLMAALPAGEEFLIALVATLLGGGTLVPVAPPRASYPPGRLARMAQTCGARAVLCTTNSRGAVEQQLIGEGEEPACPVLAVDDPEPVPDAASGGAAPCAFPIIQHTSGSTRFPKAVPVTADQIRHNCGLIQSLWGMNRDSVMINWLPHYHDMGLMGCIVYPLLSGAHSVQMSPFDMIRRPAVWLEAISEWRGTISGGPTFAFLECLNRISEEEAEGLDLSSWERAFCGAEPVPSGLLDRFHQRFAANGLARDAVFACYGMAECTLFAAGEAGGAGQAAATPEAWAGFEGCLLSAETRRHIRIAEPETGRALPDGATGEIWLSGPSVCDRYLGAADDEEAESFFDEPDGVRWLRTGDLGGIAGEHLYIAGRAKDLIIVNGRNVAAAEVEWLAGREHADLSPSAAAAFDGLQAEPGHADLLIELRAGCAPIAEPHAVAERIRKAVAAGTGVRLERIAFLPRGALPRTSSGKIRRQQAAGDLPRLHGQALCLDMARITEGAA
ncbi:AMP-binding protein [Stappia indica]|uniref:AMP-binding protein n=1 Tax=Stappia indica TaxID=538381 RepID=UPI001D1955F8|nr:AMP-binding protein [Stappia indica]MCC4244511.1 AMP-binding protein [Stappia indica]